MTLTPTMSWVPECALAEASVASACLPIAAVARDAALKICPLKVGKITKHPDCYQVTILYVRWEDVIKKYGSIKECINLLNRFKFPGWWPKRKVLCPEEHDWGGAATADWWPLPFWQACIPTAVGLWDGSWLAWCQGDLVSGLWLWHRLKHKQQILQLCGQL